MSVIERCPRCHKNHSATEDMQAAIPARVSSFLEETYYDDALCMPCVESLDEFLCFKENNPLPDDFQNLTLGVHYVMEGPYLVFTELYHVLKGYCCKNQCRNCAYGYRKT